MRKGLVYAVIAYTMWGLFPLYWKLFEDVPAGEILSHRIVWSFVFMGVFIAFGRRWGEMRQIVSNRKLLLPLATSSLLITANWLIFIWAVNTGHVIETSLGYFLTPLLSVLLAVLFLKEKPNGGQWLAVSLAGAAMLLVTVDYGSFPWVSVSLAGTFGLYGLAKKKVKTDASIGLLTETAVVVPIAALYMVFLGANHTSAAWSLPPVDLIVLLLSGVVTALPLLFFAKAARGLSLSTLGFVQYIGPTISFCLSLFVFKETVSSVMLFSFALIWAALVVYATATWRGVRVSRVRAVEANG